MKLIKVTIPNKWVVIDNFNNKKSFSSIEDAAELLEKNGVVSDEIDVALIDMHATGNSIADFGVNGSFICSFKES